MLGKWFGEWNSKNPKDIYGPGVVIGAIGAGVIAAAVLLTWGQPHATASVQTGPRGTGMSIAKFKSDIATPDPGVAGYSAAVAAAAASDADVVDAPVSDETVRAMREWTGIPTLYSGQEYSYQDAVASTMIAMTNGLNADWGDHIGEAGVNCYTCHRGQAVPSDIWFDVTPTVETMDGWGSVQNRATAVSQSTSLPSDALQKLLVDGEIIAVHDLEPRVDNEGTATWQDAERTYSLMNYFANSLNVNCNFCHNSRAFYDAEQVTPQWSTAQIGIGMVQDLNDTYLIPLGDLYPDHRLGPVNGDAPKAACATCHKGYTKPIAGQSMAADWPELAGGE